MKWQKKGMLFELEERYPWMQSHAQVPIALPINENQLRIFFGTRDTRNRTVTTYLDATASDNLQVTSPPHRIALGLGKKGCFDDAGAMPSWIVSRDNELWLYYIGWSLAVSVPYRLAIGLAVSRDKGKSFQRYASGPIFERNAIDAGWVSNPCVIQHGNRWRMYYIGCTHWIDIDDKSEPCYNIKMIESEDGIHWQGPITTCINYDEKAHAYARPFIYKEGNIYKMLYCVRGSKEFRTSAETAYRMGYAESTDGVKWIRLDEQVGLTRSREGWDSGMVAYPYALRWRHNRYLFYNGNEFGRAGFGYAIQV